MTLPDAAALLAALDSTWPPRARHQAGPWVVRDGAGGGSRVSSATTEDPIGPGDLAGVVRAMAGLDQPPVVQVRAGQSALETLLAANGWVEADRTRLMAVDLTSAVLPPHDPEIAAVWPPGPAADRMWASEGIGTARRAVMDRVAEPRAAILAGPAEAPVGAAFVALHGGIAMVHAMVVVPPARRRGLARRMLGKAADWAAAGGGRTLALAVTEANVAARALYASVGMVDVAGYHYRRAPAP